MCSMLFIKETIRVDAAETYVSLVPGSHDIPEQPVLHDAVIVRTSLRKRRMITDHSPSVCLLPNDDYHRNNIYERGSIL